MFGKPAMPLLVCRMYSRPSNYSAVCACNFWKICMKLLQSVAIFYGITTCFHKCLNMKWIH